MGSRDDLHRLVDELDEDALLTAAEVLSCMASQRAPHHDDLAAFPPRRRLSFIGAWSSGDGDLAARSSEVLRDELGHPPR